METKDIVPVYIANDSKCNVMQIHKIEIDKDIDRHNAILIYAKSLDIDLQTTLSVKKGVKGTLVMIFVGKD